MRKEHEEEVKLGAHWPIGMRRQRKSVHDYEHHARVSPNFLERRARRSKSGVLREPQDYKLRFKVLERLELD